MHDSGIDGGAVGWAGACDGLRLVAVGLRLLGDVSGWLTVTGRIMGVDGGWGKSRGDGVSEHKGAENLDNQPKAGRAGSGQAEQR
jgi:hypothetical protein